MNYAPRSKSPLMILLLVGLAVIFTLSSCGKLKMNTKPGNELGSEPGSEPGSEISLLSSFIYQFGASRLFTGYPLSSSANYEECTAFIRASSGALYCAGATDGSLGEPNAGNGDAFVMKMDANGELLWITQLGTQTRKAGLPTANLGNEFCSGITLDAQENVYCLGATDGDVGEVNAGSRDAFVLKLNSQGVYQWVTQLGAVSVAAGTTAAANQGTQYTYDAIAVDTLNNVYIGGETYGEVGEISGGGSDVFIAKISAAGALVWVKQFGSVTPLPSRVVADNAGDQACKSMAIDTLGDLYCGGWTDQNFAEASGGGGDGYVIKFNSSGTVIWARQFGAVSKVPGSPVAANQGNEGCEAIAVDALKNVYCASGSSGYIGEVNAGSSDAFIMKTDSSGTPVWATQLGTITKASGAPGNANQGSDTCINVTLDKFNNVYCTGTTQGALSEANAGNRDVFVMKVNSVGVLEWVRQFGAVSKALGAPVTANQSNDFPDGISIGTDGGVYVAGTTEDSFAETGGGGFGDIFIFKLKADGSF